MAYDEQLAERVKDALAGREAVSEQKMFGGICFMLGGNMACGVLGEELIVRLTEEDAAKALVEAGVREFDFSGRPMKSIVYVAPEAFTSDEDLAAWVDAGADFAAALPPKKKKQKK